MRLFGFSRAVLSWKSRGDRDLHCRDGDGDKQRGDRVGMGRITAGQVGMGTKSHSRAKLVFCWLNVQQELVRGDDVIGLNVLCFISAAELCHHPARQDRLPGSARARQMRCHWQPDTHHLLERTQYKGMLLLSYYAPAPNRRGH